MDWHASVYGSRLGSSGGFGLSPDEVDFDFPDEEEDIDGDPNAGVTFGSGRRQVSEQTLKQSAGSGYYRAGEVISSGRMHGLTCAPENGDTLLTASVDSAGFDGGYEVRAVIDEGQGTIVSSDCNCPAYGRYSRICKHVVALITQYNKNPRLFSEEGVPGGSGMSGGFSGSVGPTGSTGSNGFINSMRNSSGTATGSSASSRTYSSNRNQPRRTSVALHQFMAQEDSAQLDRSKARQLELLKEVSSRAAGQTGSGSDRNMHMPIGSVTVRPLVEAGEQDNWYLRLHITVPRHGISYVVKDIYQFIAAVRGQRFFSYGKRLAFVHTADSFDERSRRIIDIIDRAVEIREAISGSYDYYRTKAESAEIGLSNDEMAELMNLYVDADATFDFTPSGSWYTSALPVHVQDGDPDFDITIERADADAAGVSSKTGYIIRHHFAIDRFVEGRVASFVIVYPTMEEALGRAQTPMIFRCSQRLVNNRDMLGVLCGPESNGSLYLDAGDVEAFARTVLPNLDPVTETAASGEGSTDDSADGGAKPTNDSSSDGTSGHTAVSVDSDSDTTSTGIRARIPVELLEKRHIPCVIETYLDRDEYGISCDIQARYGDDRFHVFLGIGPHEPVVRDRETERLAVEAARHYFPAPDGVFARIAEDDDEAIHKLLGEGLPVLRGIGAVYCTPSFDGLTSSAHPTFRLGLAVKSGLVEVSPIADEIDPSEVPALLASYHKKRRYHRLQNGAFVEMDDVDISKLEEVGKDLGLKPGDMMEPVSVPAYEAYYLDSQVDSDDESDEFRSYFGGLRKVDPKAYQVPKSLSKVLRPYQVEGFRWLNAACDKGFGGILADEMGLGKTAQMLSFLLSRKDEQRKVGPNLIVCPASLVYNWEAECKKFAPELNVQVMAGSKAERHGVLEHIGAVYGKSGRAADGVEAEAVADAEAGEKSKASAKVKTESDVPDVLITSYDLLRRGIEDYEHHEFYCMVLDEAQYIKNHATKSAQAVRSVQADHRFALTGTPIENRLSELWSIFDFLMPGMLGTYKHFRERFEMPIMSGDAIVQKKLQAFVGPFILRRLKSQVLKDLPDKIENVLTVQLQGEQRKLYAALEQQLRATLNHQKDIEFKTGKIQILAQLTRLRQACCDPRLLFDNVGRNVVKDENKAWGAPAREVEEGKAERAAAARKADAEVAAAAKHTRKVSSAKLDAIEELVSNCKDAGRKMLIFSQFTSFLDLIAERLRKNGVAYDTITGSTPKKKRLELVDEFNKDATPVFLISLKAGNTGLNLTGACVVVHADPWWNAAAQNQATDRAHRIGQTQDVNVYQIVAKDTIEERILNLQHSKSDLAAKFVDSAGSQTSSSMAGLTKDDLLALLG